ncbi:hemolysin III family protein [Rhodoferax sp.]|uniref:PAQR family membrane homeostasis protein TrhA n=1 Tax=Rhodoferax sp. TaxID=50421 RepID=UPI0025DE1151|nr:hemolysin III family protein [Rhodoferax sp.]
MPTQQRPQSRGEEIANTLSHGIALAAALVGVPFLLLAAGPHLLGTGVFAVTLLLLYLSSTLYHALPAGRAKQLWLQVDYGAIYFFIAGSYTPFALSAVSGVWGWTLFALVWLLAIAGTALKVLGRLSHPWLSTGLYVAMGWLVLVAAVPLVGQLSPSGQAWLVAGGVAYTAGVVFFALDGRWRYAHAVWHGLVVLGSACHACAVLSHF